MDDAEQQLLHEFRHYTASSFIEMPTAEAPHVQPRTPSPPSQCNPSPTYQAAPVSPMDALKFSLDTGKFSDLTVLNGAEAWKAHKVILASQSSILDTMISDLEDPSILNLAADYDNEAVKLMMEYLYSGSYTTTPTAPYFCLPLHTKVYALASELHIQGLQELSSKLFAHNLKNHVADIGVYLSSIKDVYANAGGENSELRLTVLYFGVTGIPVFLADDEVWKRFTDVMADVPGFQKDVIAMLVDNSIVIDEDEKRLEVICENCGPRDPDDVYEAKMTCKGCGVEKTFHFL